MPRTYEESILRVERIISDLGSESKPLSDAVELFEEAMTCLHDASAELSRVETKIKVLVEESSATFADRAL